MSYINCFKHGKRQKTKVKTGKTGKYPLWEYSFFYKYQEESQNKYQDFEVRIRVASIYWSPKSKERLMFHVANLLVERSELYASVPDWSSCSVGIRHIGWADSEVMLYRIFSKNPRHPKVWPKVEWGKVTNPEFLNIEETWGSASDVKEIIDNDWFGH